MTQTDAIWYLKGMGIVVTGADFAQAHREGELHYAGNKGYSVAIIDEWAEWLATRYQDLRAPELPELENQHVLGHIAMLRGRVRLLQMERQRLQMENARLKCALAREQSKENE